ncbi:MAG: methionine--tRNA ligase [Candidatus Woesearchaeota archaeon]|nr:methionine--tRNA ligase [Candidatus Woesearchaeota archaeon]
MFKKPTLNNGFMTTYYVTTAIDYPNAKPHIGHAYQKVVADAFARWHKLLGEDVFFLTGTDEHGKKIADTAAPRDPQKYVDEMATEFKKAWSSLNIAYSRFIRTTDSDHISACQKIFQKVLDKGDIYLGIYEGLYCISCEAYYTELEAEGSVCPVHKKKLELIKEPSYFFRLSAYASQIKKAIEAGLVLPDARKNEMLARINQGIRDVSVSRSTLKWGIPLLHDPKHVMYVWFDALMNYVTGIGYPGPQFKKYWPAVHLLGKDNGWFHAVLWPAMLLSAEISLPAKVYVHGFLTVNGEKISKTLGNVIEPIHLVEKYGADSIRYYLMREIPAGQDGDFSEESLIHRTNADLADSLGNLLQRTSVLIQKSFEGKIPVPDHFTPADQELALQSNIVPELTQLMNNYQWHKALEKIWEFIKQCNKYATDQKPWELKDNKRKSTVLYCLAESLRIIGIVVWPFIPQSAEHIATQLGQPVPSRLSDAVFKTTTRGILEKSRILFKKHELLAFSSKTPTQIVATKDPFTALELKVGVIVRAEAHPNADKLYVLEINLGTETRIICSGIKQWYTAEQLVGKHIVLWTNLKPATFRGVESKGMLLAAEKNNVVRVLEAPEALPGTIVSVQGTIPATQAPEKELTIDSFKPIVLVTQKNAVIYQNKPLVASTHAVQVEIEDGATVR